MKQFLFESNTLTIICEGSNITVNLTEDERTKLIEVLQSDQPQGKTARQWLEELPEPYRTEAREAVESFPLRPDEYCEDVFDALNCAFDWDKTKQGEDYWYDICNKFRGLSK